MRPTLREYVAGTTERPPVMSGIGWGYLFGAFGAVLFSLKAIFVKLAYQPVDGLAANQIDAITLMAMRLGFSMPVYLAIFMVALRARKSSGADMPKPRHMILAGLLGVMGYYVCAFLDIEGLKYVTAQLERLLLFTYPVFVLIMSVVFLGYRPKLLSVMSIIFGYLGILLIFANGDIATGENLWLGTAMILACAVCFAAFQLLAKPLITRLGSTVFTCCAMFCAGIMIFTHLIVQTTLTGETQFSDLPGRIWILGLVLAIVSTLIPSFLVNIAIHRIGAQATATLGLLSPIATVFFAIAWLGEPFGVYDAIGTAMTLVGIGFYSWYARRDHVPDQVTPPNNPAARQR